MNRGLTILELMITIATVIILVTGVSIVWHRYASESHDIRRVGAVTELQRALRNYFLSRSTYPLVYPKERVTEASTVVTALVNEFFLMRTHLPLDPESPQYDFTYASDGITYEITFCQREFIQEGFVKGCANKLSPLPL